MKKRYPPILFSVLENAKLHPLRTAIVCGNAKVTYQDLEDRMNALTCSLKERNIKKGDAVSVVLKPSIEFVVSILGIMSAGATYVPISINFPKERIAHIIDSSESSLVITNEEYKESLVPASYDYFIYDTLELTKAYPKPDLAILEEDLAYVLFTSGSTGQPKGVKIRHTNLSYYTSWTAEFFKTTVQNKLPLTSDINFAAAVSQLFSCLLTGETLHIVEGLLNDPEKLFSWYTEHPDFGLYCVPSVWTLALEWFKKRKNGQVLHPPKALFLSGEDVSQHLIQETQNLFPSTPIWNLYGPTEAVANLSCKKVTSAEDISIGNPLPGTSFYVVKEDGNEAALGEQGFLYASGPGISNGYLKNDPLTQETFFKYDSENDGTVTVYNTGDVVSRVGENEYRFSGRKDQQVKINGQRIELGEIENVLTNYTAVAKTVVLFEEETLVAYVKNGSSKKVGIQELRTHLLDFLPSAAIPEKWNFIDEFPVLANGKIDRKQLPKLDFSRPELNTAYINPSNEQEEKIIALFEKIVQVEGIGLQDNFFDLGGNSLKMISLLIEVEEVFFQKISFQHFFKDPTPAALLASFSEETLVKSIPQGPKRIHSERIELSVPQKALFFFLQANPKNTSYSIAYSIALKGAIDLEQLEQAIQTIIENNELLSSKLKVEDGNPYFSREKKDVRLVLETAEDILPSERTRFIDDSISAMAATPFTFDGDLFKIKLYKVNEDTYVLGFVVSHLVFDGESLPNFIQQLAALYSAGSPNTDLLPVVSFSEITQLRANYEKSEGYKESISFWKRYLKDVRAIHGLPKIYKEKEHYSFESGTILANIDSSLRKKLQHLAAEKDVTLNMLLLSAFASTLYRIGKQEEYLIAMPFANRLSKAEQKSIGYFSNTLFVRTKCDKHKPFDKLVNEIKSDTVRILDHQQTPLDELMKILRKEGVNFTLNAFKLLFAYHQTDRYSFHNNDLQIQAKEVSNGNAKCDLQFECFDNTDEITLKVTYDKGITDEAFALQMVRIFKQTLSDVLEDFTAEIGSIPQIWSSEKEVVLRNGLGPKVDFHSKLTLFNLFQKACSEHGDAPAIEFYDTVFTYKQLEKKIILTASHLKNLELRKEHLVAIYMDHTPEMIIAMLAMASQGIPYIPLDPTYPFERTKYILEHAETNCVLTTANQSIDFLSENIQTVFVDQLIQSEEVGQNMVTEVVQDDLLYLIYTSGSTGKPKGVMVPNKGVANYLLWMQQAFGTNETTKIVAKTSISFDISAWELFLPLISGGTVVLKKRADIESPEQIAAVINEHKVTIAQFVPSGLRLFNDANMFGSIDSLKQVFCGGEKMPISLKNEVAQQFTGSLHNLYGPTEASIFMAHHRCLGSSEYVNVPIGKPIINSAMYVLDDDLQLVPRGVPGHLYIGGDILAKGYWKNKVQTENAFVPASKDIDSKTIYKTGDVGRMLMDGNFEFHGRNDTQIKIRGYRVELGEIEIAIQKYPGVRQAVAYKNTMDVDDERLNALIVSDVRINIDDLKRALGQELPKYMIPSFIYDVVEIPKLPNGKIDFNALQENTQKKAINTNGTHFNTQNTKQDKSDIEASIFKIWSEVIGHEDFSLTDNFFDAGGHSVLFLKIKERLDTLLSTNFSIIELYQYPNIKALAEEYKKRYANVISDRASSIRNRTKLKKQSYGRSRRK
ncbi:amino acid adenylation domain-containing protein [Flavobacteriaceae bacterium S356]|uniref:Amino acid adenylation domain-containing protein n=1 Tax=Asprobacillus argus TaxID=3076534 RepID=A0ABU3LCF8_9FLAO|nr:amino acid adenylation domain-containing protein [Flavobacteriaceae bacterium S356]